MGCNVSKLSLPMSPVAQCVTVCLGTSSPKTITFVPLPFGLLCKMPSNKTPMATVEQNSPSKVPILTVGDISPAVMCQFKHVWLNYFIHKKVVPDDQVSLIVSGLLDNHVDWIRSDCEHIVTLPFTAFMVEFCENYLMEDWEEDMLGELTQGTSSFGTTQSPSNQRTLSSMVPSLTYQTTSCIINLAPVWRLGY